MVNRHARSASIAVLILAVSLPLVASAQIMEADTSEGGAGDFATSFSVGYGADTAMCPSPSQNYYSCPSGVGGIFGAGGLFGEFYPSSYAEQAAAYIPRSPTMQQSYTTQPSDYGYGYNPSAYYLQPVQYGNYSTVPEYQYQQPYQYQGGYAQMYYPQYQQQYYQGGYNYYQQPQYYYPQQNYQQQNRGYGQQQYGRYTTTAQYYY